MKFYGLIGYPLDHSFSPGYFQQKWAGEGLSDCTYELYPLQELSDFQKWISEQPMLKGLNVTRPYKQQIVPLLHALSPVAVRVGAVNTIRVEWKNKKPFLTGHNTDAIAFQKTLEENGITQRGKALILGTGGASLAVAHALSELKIPYLSISRQEGKGNRTYKKIDAPLLSECTLIINCTPTGMFPDTGSKPEIPYDLLGTQHILYDLVYNPEETAFLKEGKKRGLFALNGMRMLHLQAEYAWKFWNEKTEQSTVL